MDKKDIVIIATNKCDCKTKFNELENRLNELEIYNSSVQSHKVSRSLLLEDLEERVDDFGKVLGNFAIIINDYLKYHP